MSAASIFGHTRDLVIALLIAVYTSDRIGAEEWWYRAIIVVLVVAVILLLIRMIQSRLKKLEIVSVVYCERLIRPVGISFRDKSCRWIEPADRDPESDARLIVLLPSSLAEYEEVREILAGDDPFEKFWFKLPDGSKIWLKGRIRADGKADCFDFPRVWEPIVNSKLDKVSTAKLERMMRRMNGDIRAYFRRHLKGEFKDHEVLLMSMEEYRKFLA